jgi:hypothetical protein
LIITPLPSPSDPHGVAEWFPREVGFYGGLVFPARAKQPLPDSEGASAAEMRALKALIATWRWKHGTIAAHLCLCWLGVAMIGGALDFRPHIWVTGDSGTGKSTLQYLMREILHGLGLYISKGTAAGIRQSLEIDSVPVMFDEPEAGSTQQENITKIIEMARISSTGDRDVMGSKDHTAKEFILRSTFFFSSIIVSKMEPQDANRMAILELAPFPPNTEKLKIPTDARALGRRMRRRMMLHWPRWSATLLTYQAALKLMGCTPREQDVYGTLLAAGDMLLEDSAPRADDGRVSAMLSQLAPLLTIAQGANERHFERCLGHLRTTRLSSASGKHQENVSRWVHKAVVEILIAPLDSSVRSKLLTHGLKIVTYARTPDPKEPGKYKHSASNSFASDFRHLSGAEADAGKECRADDVYLAVPGASHRGVAEIFEASAPYKGGGWIQVLAALPGAIKETALGVNFEGKTYKVVLIPIAEMMDLNEARLEALGDEARRREIEKAADQAKARSDRPKDPKEAAQWDAYQAQMTAQRDADQHDADFGGGEDWPEGS